MAAYSAICCENSSISLGDPQQIRTYLLFMFNFLQIIKINLKRLAIGRRGISYAGLAKACIADTNPDTSMFISFLVKTLHFLIRSSIPNVTD